MDTGKVLNVICDLDNENERLEIDDALQEFISKLTSNNTVGIESEEETLLGYFRESKVNTYIPSNLEIVRFIGAEDFFGLAAYDEIRSILYSSPYKVQDSVQKLNNYAKRRKSFTELLSDTRANLEKMNFESIYPDDNNYQVGLLFPTEVTKNKIANITKELNQWDRIFKTFKELTGESAEDTRINLVSNGSLDFFVDNGPEVGLLIATALCKIVDLYKKVTEIREAKKKLKDLGIPAAEQKVIDKQEKEYFNSGIDKISADILKEFAAKSIESGRMNELKISVSGHVKYMAKCVGTGIIIEINPPEDHNDIEDESEHDGGGTSKKNHEKRIAQIETVQKAMEVVKSLGSIGADITKLLGNGEAESTQ